LSIGLGRRHPVPNLTELHLSLSFARIQPLLSSKLFPYTTLFRSKRYYEVFSFLDDYYKSICNVSKVIRIGGRICYVVGNRNVKRSEEHTSELQSRENLVCRLLLEKKNTTRNVV